MYRLFRSAISAAGVAAVLAATAPDPAALCAGMADVQRWVTRDGLDLVLAQLVGTVAWVAALWLAAGLVLVAGTRLPGAAGRVSGALARRALPGGLRRVAAVAVGASLATSALPAMSSPSAAAEGGGKAPSAAVSTPLAPNRRITALASTVDWPAIEEGRTGWSTGMEDAVITGAGRIRLVSTVDWRIAVEKSEPARVRATHAPASPADGVAPAPAPDWPIGAPAATASGSVYAPAPDWPVVAAASARNGAVVPPARDWPHDPSVPAANDAIPAPAPDWPDDPPAPAANDAIPAPAPDWPDGAVSTVTPDRPGAGSGSRAAVATYAAGAEPARLVVRPGDTLWSIASRRLGPGAPAPAVAVEWRRWHAANLTVIGPDPRRLPVGISLRAPGTS